MNKLAHDLGRMIGSMLKLAQPQPWYKRFGDAVLHSAINIPAHAAGVIGDVVPPLRKWTDPVSKYYEMPGAVEPTVPGDFGRPYLRFMKQQFPALHQAIYGQKPAATPAPAQSTAPAQPAPAQPANQAAPARQRRVIGRGKYGAKIYALD